MLSIINNLELNEKYKEKLLENLKLFNSCMINVLKGKKGNDIFYMLKNI